MRRPEPATCGVPGCTSRAVYANCTAELTVVLCRRHLERWRVEQDDEQRVDHEPARRGQAQEAAA